MERALAIYLSRQIPLHAASTFVCISEWLHPCRRVLTPFASQPPLRELLVYVIAQKPLRPLLLQMRSPLRAALGSLTLQKLEREV